MLGRNTICPWHDGNALNAATFHAETFPARAVSAIHRAPEDHPAKKPSDLLTVEFAVPGIPCAGLNGGRVVVSRTGALS